ncbi:transcriptional regulator [Nocardioides immobilis]|uniref:Transcriptional regulator n=1 Tax=Nocardioides immobilis TaxID=2049295 RepID=A0A417Y0C8_9ACTN|nr:helix-turn-helix domain-containing protein [Nocardioides immobilis]RHW26065.1 transcriptional regulator [Nocardioides immobilis]
MAEQQARPNETAAVDPDHPLLSALQPLLERVQGRFVAPDDMGPADVPLVWDGEVVAGVRLPSSPPAAASEAVGDLGRLLEDLADELGVPLSQLARAEKQRAVRLLEERGAFTYRKSAETVAEALGVSRFTVYNYLNRTGS